MQTQGKHGLMSVKNSAAGGKSGFVSAAKEETAAELAPENYPLKWLVGRWHGGGILAYENIRPGAYLHELTLRASHGSPYLTYESKIWLAEGEAGPAEKEMKEMSGAQRYALLAKHCLWAQSCGYLRVNPEGARRADGSAEVQAMVASPSGTAQIWVGLADASRMTLITDAVARCTAETQPESANLRLALSAGDLVYAYGMQAFGYRMQNYLTGRLTRVTELRESGEK